MTDPTPVQTDEQLITITRVFDAPRELVFQAWTDPDQLARWFGPAGSDVPRESVEVDLRVGGRVALTIVRAGGGMEYQLRYEISELAEPELLVLKSDPMPQVGLDHPTFTRIELKEADGQTRMTLTDGPFPAPGGQHAAAGWEHAFDKLEALFAPAA
jgi:uncharacterized protein YndB with AHSA1/START domain